MEELQNDIKTLLELMGFKDFSLTPSAEHNRIGIFLNESEISPKLLPAFLSNLDHILKLVAKKRAVPESVFIDVNNYRRKREEIIIEMAKGAARKVLAAREEVALPVMNAYERRLIHLELSSRPDVKTESAGEGKDRYVVVKPI